MSEKKQLNDEELVKVNGGAGSNIVCTECGSSNVRDLGATGDNGVHTYMCKTCGAKFTPEE